MHNKNTKQGSLFLVSTGIGDPENITLKALNTIRQANLILAMPFVQKQIEPYFPENVEIMDAGHGLFTPLARCDDTKIEHVEKTENEVRHRIRQVIKSGGCVVVAEFGDPTLFGPQIGYMSEFDDLNPTIISGISSFNAANALLKQSILQTMNSNLMLSSVKAIQTYQGKMPDVLVLFTMRLEMESLINYLSEHYQPDTQVALVFNAGFTEKQQVVYTSLSSLMQTVDSLDIPWECLIYIGKLQNIESSAFANDTVSND